MTPQKVLPAPFLTKTFQLVDDPSSDEIVSWNENGTTFVVWKTADFARDMLPIYFKHNNFSSFVRQLNTYGFRKIVQEKWEFANEYFRRGERDLLFKICRRRTVMLPSSSNSGEDIGSTSSTSPDSRNMGSVDMDTAAHYADLVEENERLRRENEVLSSELDLAKNQCEELVGYLTDHLKVAQEEVDKIMSKANDRCCDNKTEENGDKKEGDVKEDDEVDEDDEEEEEDDDGEPGVKLFGVWLKPKKEKKVKKVKKKKNVKRDRDEKMKCSDDEPPAKEMKVAADDEARA